MSRAYQGKPGKGLHSERLLTRDRTQTRNTALDDARQTKQKEINLWVKTAEIKQMLHKKNEVTDAGGME